MYNVRGQMGREVREKGGKMAYVRGQMGREVREKGGKMAYVRGQMDKFYVRCFR
jgi:hypothetical protein